jgi:hypothetical protein
MSSKKEMAAEKPKRKYSPPKAHSASEKVQAVLAIWTERVKTAEVMRTLQVNYITLQQWQDRAMEGMLQALEPRVNLTDGGALSPKLQAILAKRQVQPARAKLTDRLGKLQEVAPEEKVPPTP